MLSYPVRLIPTERGTVRAMFPDVPETLAEAATEQAAIVQAKFCLEMTLGHYLHAGRAIPAPSDICGAPTVTTDKFALAAEDALAAG